MSQLTIVDLNFCETELPGKSEVKGGLDYSATYDTSVDTANSSGYVADYSVDKSGYRYTVGGTVSGAVASAAAGAIAVGGKTYAVASSVASTG